VKRLIFVIGALLLAQAHPAIAQDILIDGLEAAISCAGDIRKHCSGIEPGEGRIRACIKEKFAELSPECKDALGELIAARFKLPDDGKNATVKRFENLRKMRYCEVFLIAGDPVTGNLQAAFYNTTALNNAADGCDTCPAALWAKVDAEKLKKQYEVIGVFKNGPRHWATDWIELPVGNQRDFDGLQARWMGQVQLPKGVKLGKKGSTAYKPTTVARKSQMGFKKGEPVFILEDPDGMPWVMQAYSNIVDPHLTYEGLQTLDKKLKLAPGWKYRVKVLDKDLEIRAVNGQARIVQDDLENTYDACFDDACSFKP
jgi:hypothetical protein